MFSLLFVVAGFAPLAEALRDVGYQNGKTLFGVAYDFRKAPSKFHMAFHQHSFNETMIL